MRSPGTPPHQREVQRQIALACVYSLVMAALGVACLSGAAGALLFKNGPGFHGFQTTAIGLIGTAGAFAFGRVALRHIRMRAKVLASLKRLQDENRLRLPP